MSATTVKGFVPGQMRPVNEHRPTQIRAVGLTFWCKVQIAAGLLLGTGATVVGLCMAYALLNGTPQ